MFFSIKTEGLSHAMIFLYGRIMVLGELLTGWSEWGPDIPFAGIWLGSAGDRLQILSGQSI